MDIRTECILFQRSHTNSYLVHKKVLDITNYHGNANSQDKWIEVTTNLKTEIHEDLLHAEQKNQIAQFKKQVT